MTDEQHKQIVNAYQIGLFLDGIGIDSKGHNKTILANQIAEHKLSKIDVENIVEGLLMLKGGENKLLDDLDNDEHKELVANLVHIHQNSNEGLKVLYDIIQELTDNSIHSEGYVTASKQSYGAIESHHISAVKNALSDTADSPVKASLFKNTNELQTDNGYTKWALRATRLALRPVESAKDFGSMLKVLIPKSI